MKKIVQGAFSQSVDHETGEVISESSFNVVRFPQEPPFIKMYINDLCAISGVADADQALLRHLLSRLDYEGYVVLTPRVRDSIGRALSIKPKTFRNRLNSLVKADLVKPISRNEYQVNPNYFARGDWKNICEQKLSYKMVVSYSENGRTIETGKLEGDAHKQKDLPLGVQWSNPRK